MVAKRWESSAFCGAPLTKKPMWEGQTNSFPASREKKSHLEAEEMESRAPGWRDPVLPPQCRSGALAREPWLLGFEGPFGVPRGFRCVSLKASEAEMGLICCWKQALPGFSGVGWSLLD